MASRTHPPSPLPPLPFHVILRFSGSYEDLRIYLPVYPYLFYFFIVLIMHMTVSLSLFFSLLSSVSLPSYFFNLSFFFTYFLVISCFSLWHRSSFSLFTVIFNPPNPVFYPRLPFSFSPFLSSAQPINLFIFSLPLFTFISSILPADIFFLSSIFSSFIIHMFCWSCILFLFSFSFRCFTCMSCFRKCFFLFYLFVFVFYFFH